MLSEGLNHRMFKPQKILYENGPKGIGPQPDILDFSLTGFLYWHNSESTSFDGTYNNS